MRILENSLIIQARNYHGNSWAKLLLGKTAVLSVSNRICDNKSCCDITCSLVILNCVVN